MLAGSPDDGLQQLGFGGVGPHCCSVQLRPAVGWWVCRGPCAGCMIWGRAGGSQPLPPFCGHCKHTYRMWCLRLLLLPSTAGGVWVLNQQPFTSTGLVARVSRPDIVLQLRPAVRKVRSCRGHLQDVPELPRVCCELRTSTARRQATAALWVGVAHC